MTNLSHQMIVQIYDRDLITKEEARELLGVTKTPKPQKPQKAAAK